MVGCASVVNGTTHGMRVDTLKDGQPAIGADCTATNDYGDLKFKSGETIQVRRSSQDLSLVCNSATNGAARGKAISRANGGMFGNIILGGGIGAIVDHNRGTAYTYPTWVRLNFGDDLVFDRSDEKEGFPLSGRNTSGVQVGAPTPAPAAPASTN